VLLDFSKRIKNGEVLDEDKLEQKLESIKADQIFFTSVFKNFAKNNPEASFEDFKGLAFETINGIDFKEEDISKMISIAQKNYQEDEAMQKLVIESLQEGLQKENSQFFVLRLKGEIVAFDRFDDEGEYFYVGSFNVDADYRGSAIGETMMKHSFDLKAKEKPLQGITDPKKIICSKYVEDEGFIISGILHTLFDGKELFEVEILRDDQKNQNYLYRSQHKPEDLLDAYQNQQKEFTIGASRRSQTLNEKRPFLMSFDQKEELEKFTNLADKLIGGYGYVITRYAQLGKKNGKVLVAFEQKLS
ncbi:MAG: GNAT family N-acetyltransferase, partial [Candidatus Moraniibacteriota bacterium]